MIENIKNKLINNELVVGTTVSLRDASITELFACAGFDFIWVDSEHTSLEKTDIFHHKLAAHSNRTPIFVRVAWNDPILVKPILDMGIDGIIFPFIKTADDAKLAVSSCMYPPKGIRGYGPLSAIKYGFVSQNDYLANADNSIWKVMQIEHVDGVTNLEDIVSVDGVDAVLIGANDLSASIGLLGQIEHPSVTKLLDQIVHICTEKNIPVGMALYNSQDIRQWIDKGIHWIVIGGDIGYLKYSAFDALEKTRKYWLDKEEK